MNRQNLTFIDPKPFLKLADRPELRAYIAGLLDSDGSIGIYHRRDYHREGVYVSCKLVVSFATSSKATACRYRELKTLYGGFLRRNKPPSNRVPLVVWALECEKANQLLSKIEPYMAGRREQAQLALAFYKLLHTYPRNSHKQRLLHPQQELMKLQMHRLKKEGLNEP